MSEQNNQDDEQVFESVSAFDQLMNTSETVDDAPSFPIVFRGYDKIEVDQAFAELRSRVRAADEGSKAEQAEIVENLRTRLAAANRKLAKAEDHGRDELAKVEADLAATAARAAEAESRIDALTEQLLNTPVGEGDEPTSAERGQFEEILRVAEDQASAIIRNATTQAERLLASAREEIDLRRGEAHADAEAIRAEAESDAAQTRLRIDTELTAHNAQLERSKAHADEKTAQAEQEAASIRTEAEKGAAALRALVTRETEEARAEAEEAVREMRMRTLEFEESLTRRQDDAQQEFLMLHNQAVAHAERITADANDQVAASLDHAKRVQSKADDFDKLMRAQSQQVEADARVRAGEILNRASAKAEKIINTVTEHSHAVLRDAEDRTRNLRWQQHQLTSFMAEVKELIRPEGVVAAGAAAPAKTDAAPRPTASTASEEHASEHEYAEPLVGDNDTDDEEPTFASGAVEVIELDGIELDEDEELEDDDFTGGVTIEVVEVENRS